MKINYIIAVIVLFLILIAGFSKNIYAATTPAPSPTPNQGEIPQQVLDELKTRIASTTAKLKLVEKRGIIATVTDVTNTQITLTDVNGNVRFVDVDELTKFSNPNIKANTSFGISDITKGTKLGILGLYNKQSRRILARQIEVLTLPKILTGAVSSIDSKQFNFNLVSEDNRQTLIDIETVTKIYSYTAGASLVNSGFSKIKVNQTVIVIGFPDKQNPDRIIASRVLLFPDVPKSPKIEYIPALNPEASVIPSTGSGRKLTPIIK